MQFCGCGEAPVLSLKMEGEIKPMLPMADHDSSGALDQSEVSASSVSIVLSNSQGDKKVVINLFILLYLYTTFLPLWVSQTFSYPSVDQHQTYLTATWLF